MNSISTFSGGFTVASQLFKLALPVLLHMAASTTADMYPEEGCFDSLECQVFQIASLHPYEVDDARGVRQEDSYECLHGSMSYDLDLPQEFLDSHPFIDSGNTHISIPGACINGTAVTYPSNTTITMLPQHRSRKLQQYPSHGNKTVLIVRVNEKGRYYSPSSWTLRDKGGSFFNQMNDCSQGKTRFVSPPQGNGIRLGLYDIRLDFDVDGMWSRDIERRHALPRLGAIGGEAAFDYVIYCFPPGVVDSRGNEHWGAYAILNHPRSVYNYRYCDQLTYLMHEVGHNFGLQHSRQGGYEYGDITGNMGGGVFAQRGPKSCYNAHKHWQLGWYDEESLDLTDSIRTTAWGGRLLAFVDARHHATETDVVVMKVGEYYAQFNRAKSFNDGTREFRDRVTIVSTLPTSRASDTPKTNLEAGIAKGVGGASTKFTVSNFDDSGFSLVFEVCDQVYEPSGDYVHLSVHLDDGVQTSQCNVPLPVITPSPTATPTISVMPTSSPSSSPSAEPTMSLEPSARPSESPTGMPSSSPTFRVTPSPSVSPSVAPTMDCTGLDSAGLVPVNRGHGPQTCAWIGQRKWWKQYLCRPGFDAFEQCQETCDSCGNQGDDISTTDNCEDSPKMFHVNEYLGSRRCWQLQRFFERSPRWKDKLCAPDQPAYDHCPETCGKCTDTCEDQADKIFYVNRRQGHQDCAWLSKRPMWQAILCHEGHDAYKYCNELCNTCP